MFQPLQTGRLGLTAQQRNIDTIGNNIANLSTIGYKKVRLDFQDTLYTRMFNKEDMGPHMNLQRGTGVREYQTARILGQGALLSTGRAIDFALEGHGYFVLENPNPGPVDEETGEEAPDTYYYSRDGAFYLSVEYGEDGDEPGSYLVDGRGLYVLDVNGDRIMIPDPDSLSCDADGNLYITVGSDTVFVARLGLIDFTNPGGLEAVGNNVFMQTVNSGDPIGVTALVHQSFTEGSNVDLAEEMTRMIRAQRAYQIASRCVTTADQMMQVANAIRS